MKMFTLLLILFCNTCLAQNFMMKMHVLEHYRNKTVKYDTIKVIWGIDYKNDISLVWDDRFLYLRQKYQYKTTKEQRRLIAKIEEKYGLNKKQLKLNVLLDGLYLDEQGGIYYVTIYMDNGIAIWISRMDEKTPCFYFQMLNV